ncbi:MAG: metallophosphoesterase, partial [Muribaculaceae bacterium]|nr:metallophosphoesterase [Muribaculaceae bacterium]
MRGFSALSIIILFVATILIDWYIYVSIRKFARKRKTLWSRLYLICSLLCLGLVVAICSWSGDDSGNSLTALMWLLYAYFSIYIPKFIYVVVSGIGRICTKFINKRNNNKRNGGYYSCVAGGAVAALLFIGMWIGVGYTRNKIEIVKVNIESSKLPASFDGYRIVQFSDAHVGTWGTDTTFISKLVRTINGLQPDLIVFTGDVVNRNTEELRPFIEVFKQLRAKDGVISVLGNHDYGDYMHWNSESEYLANQRLLAKWEKDMGWDLLNNDYRFLKNGEDSIAIIGVENWGEPPFHQYGKLMKSYSPNGDSSQDLKDDKFKILLSHNPEHWNREVTNVSNIDLTLS